MANVNLCMLSGSVTSEPKTFDWGCSFKVSSVDKTYEVENRAEVDVIVFGELATACSKSIDQGARVYVEGKLRSKSKDLPSGKKHYWTELHAVKVERM